MVSGFFTSPHDHERIRSGEASEILIASKSSGWVCWLKRFRRSFIACLREERILGRAEVRRERNQGAGSGEQGKSSKRMAFPCSLLPQPCSLTVLPAPCRSPASGSP